MSSFWQGWPADRIAAPVMLEAGGTAPCGVDLEDSMQWMFWKYGAGRRDAGPPEEDTVAPSRRRFLIGLGVAGGLALVAPSVILTAPADAAEPDPDPALPDGEDDGSYEVAQYRDDRRRRRRRRRRQRRRRRDRRQDRRWRGGGGANGAGAGGTAAGAAWMSARSPSATRLNAPS